MIQPPSPAAEHAKTCTTSVVDSVSWASSNHPVGHSPPFVMERFRHKPPRDVSAGESPVSLCGLGLHLDTGTVKLTRHTGSASRPFALSHFRIASTAGCFSGSRAIQGC